MSIYGTGWILRFPRYEGAEYDDHWVEVVAQVVPAHIGHPTHYGRGDPYAAFLPPVVQPDVTDSLTLDYSVPRAVVIVTDDAEKVGQRYVDPLLTLSGAEYRAITWVELHQRITEALHQRWAAGDGAEDEGDVEGEDEVQA